MSGTAESTGSSAGGFPQVAKKGVLFKRTDYTREWKPRHFVLSPPQLGYCLPESPAKVHKSLDLTMCKIAKGEGTVHWGGHVLHTLVVSKPGAGVSYALGALDAEDAEAWVAVLKKTAGDATRNFMRTFQQQQQRRAAEADTPRQPTPRAAPTEPEAPPRRAPPVEQPPQPPQLQPRTSRSAPASPQPPKLTSPRPAPRAPQHHPPPEPPPSFVVFLLPSLCYAALRLAPEPLYGLRGLVFLLSLGALVWRRDHFAPRGFLLGSALKTD